MTILPLKASWKNVYVERTWLLSNSGHLPVILNSMAEADMSTVIEKITIVTFLSLKILNHELMPRWSCSCHKHLAAFNKCGALTHTSNKVWICFELLFFTPHFHYNVANVCNVSVCNVTKFSFYSWAVQSVKPPIFIRYHYHVLMRVITNFQLKLLILMPWITNSVFKGLACLQEPHQLWMILYPSAPLSMDHLVNSLFKHSLVHTHWNLAGL